MFSLLLWPFRLAYWAWTWTFIVSAWLTVLFVPVLVVLIALEFVLPGNNFPFLFNFDPTDLNPQTGHPYGP